jgi:hypothetical protein
MLTLLICQVLPVTCARFALARQTVAGEEGLEPPTNGFGDHCSTLELLPFGIQLSCALKNRLSGIPGGGRLLLLWGLHGGRSGPGLAGVFVR